VLWLYPFVALGAATAPVFDELRARRTKLAVAAAAIAAVLLPLTWNPGWLPQAAGQVLGAAGPAVGGYVWVLCRFALALAEIVLTFVVVGFCGERVQRWHAIFGVNTLGVYALHQFFLPWHVLREPWSQLLTFAFALGCSLAFTAGISRYRVASRLLLGKGAASPLFAQGGQSAG
jgi:fucose 4-O-acetylase-like acetyltransferase